MTMRRLVILAITGAVILVMLLVFAAANWMVLPVFAAVLIAALTWLACLSWLMGTTWVFAPGKEND